MFFFIILFLAITYLFLIAPKILNRVDFTPFQGWYYAHRGFHNSDFPENSLGAFRLAVENNYGIELDVQLSKDGTPIVFHDETLSRVCGVEKKVKECNYEELKAMKLYKSAEKIPTLMEVLELVNGRVPLIIELKLHSNDTSVCDVVSDILVNYKGVYCIESFNPVAIKWYKKHYPNVIRGQLSTKFVNSHNGNNFILNFILQNLLFNFITKPDFIAFNHKYRSIISFVLCKKLFGIPTIAYTIQSKEELDASNKSFDLFIFEGFRA